MKRIKLILICLLIGCILCGCSLWMDGEYLSVTPHQEPDSKPDNESSEVSTYAELWNALNGLVEAGTAKGVIYINEIEESVIDVYMDRAIRYVCDDCPVGAYAVESIQYELGTNAGKPAVAVDITYLHGRSEILRIPKAEDMAAAITIITDAMAECEASVVLRVGRYDKIDFTQTAQDYADAHPELCMEMPQVTANVYPQSGADRIIEVTFAYQTSRESLRTMQEQVRPIFASARLYVTGGALTQQKYAQLYSFLMERYNYTIETSITPSYSLLCHGVGDSRAFAVAYTAMCTQSGLECITVSGTKAGEPWFWNIICDEGIYYHVDLLQCSWDGGFLELTDADMTGYVWDYSANPVCGPETETEPENP